MKPSFSHAVSDAALLMILSCVIGQVLIFTRLYRTLGGFVVVLLICVLPIALPITHLLWYRVRKDLYRFQNSPWAKYEIYVRLTVDPQDASQNSLILYMSAEGSHEGNWIFLPPGNYQVEADFPVNNDIVCELSPHPKTGSFVPFLAVGEGATSSTMNVDQPVAGWMRVTSSTSDARWRLSIRSLSLNPITSDRQQRFTINCTYSLQHSGDFSGTTVNLPTGYYELQWRTPYSQIRVVLEDSAGDQPDLVLVHRTQRTGRLLSRPTQFYVPQDSDYRFKITVWPNSRDDKWHITCISVEE